MHLAQAIFPEQMPPGPWDLIVCSEVLYSLDGPAFAAAIERLRDALSGGAVLVAVHWRPAGPERPQTAAAVHARLRTAPWLRTISDLSTEDYLLDVLERT